MNNNLTQFYFKLTITMLFSYGYGQEQISNNKKCRRTLEISIAIRMRRIDAGRIDR
jgi:hypothetical protein